MITEDYVSFEIAKLLNEKEFDERSTASYDLKGRLQEGSAYWNSTPSWYAAPTLQMTMKWLREVHKIHIVIGWLPNSKLFFTHICDMNSGYPKRNKHEYTSYEEAIEEALKYTLENLI